MDRKEAAREGLVRVGQGDGPRRDRALDPRQRARVALGARRPHHSWSSEIGDRLDVIMVPKVEGAWDIHYVDRLLAQLEAQARPRAADPRPRDPRDRAGRGEPRGDRHRQPAHAGHELRAGRPRGLAAHEDHARRRRPPRLPGDRGPGPRRPRRRRAPPPSRTPGTTRSPAWSTPAPPPGILPFYGPYGDIKDIAGCETQFRAAFLLGCVGAWSLHPVQIDIAKKVFSPDPEEVRFAKKVIEAIPDGRGVHMIDGKMQDDATWKQCKVMVDLAEQLAEKDPELAEAYGLRADARLTRALLRVRVAPDRQAGGDPGHRLRLRHDAPRRPARSPSGSAARW